MKRLLIIIWIPIETGPFVSDCGPVTVLNKGIFSLAWNASAWGSLWLTSDGKVHLPWNALGSARLINASDKIVHIPGKAAFFLSFTQHCKKNTFAFVSVKDGYTSCGCIGRVLGAFKIVIALVFLQTKL